MAQKRTVTDSRQDKPLVFSASVFIFDAVLSSRNVSLRYANYPITKNFEIKTRSGTIARLLGPVYRAVQL